MSLSAHSNQAGVRRHPAGSQRHLVSAVLAVGVLVWVVSALLWDTVSMSVFALSVAVAGGALLAWQTRVASAARAAADRGPAGHGTRFHVADGGAGLSRPFARQRESRATTGPRVQDGGAFPSRRHN